VKCKVKNPTRKTGVRGTRLGWWYNSAEPKAAKKPMSVQLTGRNE